MPENGRLGAILLGAFCQGSWQPEPAAQVIARALIDLGWEVSMTSQKGKLASIALRTTG
jgi:hypothetical protein